MWKQQRNLATGIGQYALLVIALTGSSQNWAQESPASTAASPETVQLLLKKIDQLEARVSELEAREEKQDTASAAAVADAMTRSTMELLGAGRGPHTTPANSEKSTQAIPVPTGSEQAQPESAMNDRMDVNKTLMRIRGFGDVTFNGDTHAGESSAFSLGQLDLFISSDMSDRFRFLSEIVFEGGPDNIYGVQVGPKNSFGVDIERYLLQYSLNDYFKIAIGRGHTAIGYYNTAYHHSTWMQTTTARPFIFEFEDKGGILPVHTVGLSASGSIPSSALGLHYVAEIGNGRESRNALTDEPVENVISDQNRKAINLALFARPTRIEGLQAGFSVYRDILSPANQPRIGETILAAHAILIRPKYEWLSEVLLDRHAPFGSPIVFHTPGFYSQVSKQFGSYRPYFRYEYLNVAPNEPVFPDVALRHGPIAGLRYDPNESVTLKLEYEYTFLRNQTGVNGLTSQIGFTF